MRSAIFLLIVAALVVYAAVATPYPRLAWWLATAAPPPTLFVPVEGVRTGAIRSSFGAPRPGGRTHRGIDIMAPRGTAVLAAAHGVVTSTVPNRLGGNVVWILGAGGRVYYYAHLEKLAPEIRVGRIMTAGEVIGTVGDTGNARGGPPHLHFAIYDAGGIFGGGSGAIDPYPVLKAKAPL